MNDDLAYLGGFGNQLSTEALPGALPQGCNSPQKAPYGLYAEQFSGTAFTQPRSEARRSWLYRIHPSALHPAFRRLQRQLLGMKLAPPNPNRLRWDPLPFPEAPTDFLDGWTCMAASAEAGDVSGVSLYTYTANCSMQRVVFNADGELLIVPQQGRLGIDTEMGRLEIEPQEIAVLPRGLRFRVQLLDGQARGYIAENHAAPLRLPDLGPIGSNGLANPRDFMYPVARYEHIQKPTELVQKFLGELWSCQLPHSPLDVVAWHGNNAPCKYDLRRFNTLGTVSFDHPDPSIFTVLTSPGSQPGEANLDLAIFPPRWMVAENTFRPPWFHRNVMNEYMGLIQGAYDAKAEGFLPGGVSLHPCMSAHGPDADTSGRAMSAQLVPVKLEQTLAFMFETRQVLRPTELAMNSASLQPDYDGCWASLPELFHGERP